MKVSTPTSSDGYLPNKKESMYFFIDNWLLFKTAVNLTQGPEIALGQITVDG